MNVRTGSVSNFRSLLSCLCEYCVPDLAPESLCHDLFMTTSNRGPALGRSLPFARQSDSRYDLHTVLVTLKLRGIELALLGQRTKSYPPSAEYDRSDLVQSCPTCQAPNH